MQVVLSGAPSFGGQLLKCTNRGCQKDFRKRQNEVAEVHGGYFRVYHTDDIVGAGSEVSKILSQLLVVLQME